MHGAAGRECIKRLIDMKADINSEVFITSHPSAPMLSAHWVNTSINVVNVTEYKCPVVGCAEG
jgi:hypothetical protein